MYAMPRERPTVLIRCVSSVSKTNSYKHMKEIHTPSHAELEEEAHQNQRPVDLSES
jgi:hypothetical protein